MPSCKSILLIVPILALIPAAPLQSQAPRADNYYAAGNHLEITTPMAAPT